MFPISLATTIPLSVSMNLITLDSTCKWDPTVFVFFRLLSPLPHFIGPGAPAKLRLRRPAQCQVIRWGWCIFLHIPHKKISISHKLVITRYGADYQLQWWKGEFLRLGKWLIMINTCYFSVLQSYWKEKEAKQVAYHGMFTCCFAMVFKNSISNKYINLNWSPFVLKWWVWKHIKYIFCCLWYKMDSQTVQHDRRQLYFSDKK